jgi:MFS family permease
VLGIIALVAFVTALDNTVVATAAPSIAADLRLGLAATQWITLGYMLPFAGLLLTTGTIVDRYGAGVVLRVGLAAFGGGALLAGGTRSEALLITARVLQGAAAALLVPATLSLVRNNLPERRRQAGAATWTAALAAALAAGPVVGGAISQYFGWSWIFFSNVPFALAGLLLAIGLPTAPARADERINARGMLLAALTMVFGTAALVGLGDHRAYGPVPWTVFAAAAVLGATVFVLEDRRSARPIIPSTLLRRRFFTGGLVIQVLWGLGVSGVFFFTPLVHQRWLGLAPGAAALPLVAVAVALVLATPFVGGAVRRLGPGVAVAAGLFAVAAGLFAIAMVNHIPEVAPRIPGLVLIGAGSAFTVPLTTCALDVVSEEQSGIASGVLTAGREFSSALGVALIGAVLATVSAVGATTATDTGVTGLPAARSLADGYTVGLLVAAALELLAALLTLAVFGRRVVVPGGSAQARPAQRVSAIDAG